MLTVLMFIHCRQIIIIINVSHLSVMTSLQDVATVIPVAVAKDAWMLETSLKKHNQDSDQLGVTDTEGCSSFKVDYTKLH